MNGVEGMNEMCEPADKGGFLVRWEPRGDGGTGLAGRVDSREVGAGGEEMRAKGMFLQGP